MPRILVFPTLYEVQPLVHLEAMAFGLPVVASRIPEIEETMQSGEASAILVDPNNPDEIAHAILQLLGDEALRHQLSASGQKLVAERFDWTQIARQMLNLYAQLAERERGEQH